jgi:hypothetical protein
MYKGNQVNKKHIDILIEVPYLWMHDGYGHSAPEVINMVSKFAEENSLSWAVVRAHVMTNLINLDTASKNIMKHFVNIRDVGSCNILFRYHYPKSERYGAKKLVSYTMFETDKCPDAWVDVLNAADLVLVPNPYLQSIFSAALTSRVETLLLPLHKEYYDICSNDELVKSLPKKTTFSFVGTANGSNDRKGIIELCNVFSKTSLSNDATLIVKSRSFNKKCNGVVSQHPSKNISSLKDFYLSTHAGVYPSHGEGYGLPQFESAILGRPVIVADNTSMSWAKDIFPWVYSVECLPRPAIYSQRVPGDVGNWGYCNMDDFIHHMELINTIWKENNKYYIDSIIDAHNNNVLRETIDRDKIYNTLSSQLKQLLED